VSSSLNAKAVIQPTIVIVLGPPGSGKGTQCKRLARILQIPHISTGDLLRAHVSRGTNLGLQVQEVMERGGLVSDDQVLEMLKDRLLQPDCLEGFVLDGFPRSQQQAVMLDDCLAHVSLGGASAKTIFRLVISEAAVVRRLAGRRTCPTCGKTFSCSESLQGTPKCDADGSSLIIRIDDNEETMRTRLRVFEQLIPSIVAYYEDRGSVLEISADHCVDEVTNNILYELERAKNPKERMADK
jgi:adenylate kinase